MILPFYPFKLTFVRILLGQVSPTLKRFCLTVKFNLHVSFNPFCTDKVPFRHSPSIAQCQQKAFFVSRLWTIEWTSAIVVAKNNDLLGVQMIIVSWTVKEEWGRRPFSFLRQGTKQLCARFVGKPRRWKQQKQWQTAYPRSTLILTKVEAQKPI